ncbi:hypothetical protein Tco_1070372 [Tanacetum coccineum]|uniref:Xylulose kinase-1 n=1 Tax=Tanacetum coccineum TaxID=301880 RepID=A0ABQ5HL64_9ASTR
MSTLKFAETHNLVAFLEKPEESNGFEEIIDFLNTNSVQYALMVNPTIYTTCIEQFWTFAKVKTVNEERQIQTLINKKKVIITEMSIRSDLKLDDAEGTDYLPTATIFAELERMGYENLTQKLTFYKAYFSSQWKFPIHTILQCRSAKTTSWNEFSSTMASAIICLATNKNFNFSKYIFYNMVKNLEGGKKSRRKQRKDSGPTKPIPDAAINEEHVATPSCDPPQSETTKSNQALEIESLKRRVKSLVKRRKLRTPGFKRLRKVGSASRVESSIDVSLGAQEDASKHKRKIVDLDADAEEKEVAEKEVSVADPLTLAHTLIEIKAAKPKAVTSVATTTTTTRPKARGAKDKGKAKMVEPEKPLKKKVQIAIDEEVARNLEAQLQVELEEEERISRLKEEKAIIALLESWDNTQAMMDADFQLA